MCTSNIRRIDTYTSFFKIDVLRTPYAKRYTATRPTLVSTAAPGDPCHGRQIGYLRRDSQCRGKVGAGEWLHLALRIQDQLGKRHLVVQHLLEESLGRVYGCRTDVVRLDLNQLQVQMGPGVGEAVQ